MTDRPPDQGLLSIGLGDRFGREGEAQLAAVQQFCREYGIPVTPVWNKSYREHMLTGTHPRDTRQEADEAVARLGWQGPYFVDADHVTAATLEPFLPYCDYFTIDVGHLLDVPPDPAEFEQTRELLAPWCGRRILLPEGGVLELSAETADVAARRYGRALAEITQVVERLRRQQDDCRIEISADEVESPQSPAELFCLLALLAGREVTVHALAPRFPGAFLKGIDYRGDLQAFEAYLRQVVAILELARREFGWRELRLSVHSGSDKSSLYPILHRCTVAAGMGLHLKTAGTTWLEEVAALAEVEEDGWAFVRELYQRAWRRRADLVRPYATVVGIREEQLPDPEGVATWSGRQFAAALRPSAAPPPYHEDLRQLVHIAYPIAAEAGDEFLQLLEHYRDRIAPRVTENLYRRHLVGVFGGGRSSKLEVRS